MGQTGDADIDDPKKSPTATIPGLIEKEYSCPAAFLACFPMEVVMFETERFVADCRAALAGDPTHKAIREVLARAVSDPAAVLKGLGEPRRAEFKNSFIRMH